jgi:lipopolysaccharide/colanic/teichoic acid biosynthesis glycosyltransferase
MVAAALAIKISSRGPILFAQERAGLGGRPFTMFKFRTMVENADAIKPQLMHLNQQDGPAFKIKDDPRVTAVGRLLRSTSIDELPQLWNVLRGDMSLVGPRPLPINESLGCRDWHRRRVDVTPGLTCIWQVEGRSQVAFDEWMRMDLQYIRRRRPFEDLRLLLHTIRVVLSGKGAH